MLTDLLTYILTYLLTYMYLLTYLLAYLLTTNFNVSIANVKYATLRVSQLCFQWSVCWPVTMHQLLKTCLSLKTLKLFKLMMYVKFAKSTL